ncbi:hypothetical protein B0J18DRAFT_422712 [Chaetomium sp. MPI-SDFR-AT-0129]|nr:hypothetical protein B0J18DRAFT_422712 [Chaetomium sp. MPI-SDFR-AT-0129]
MRANLVSNAFAAAALSSLGGITVVGENEQQPPQRAGSQSFHLMDMLLIDGGRYLDQNGTTLDQVPEFLSANLTLDFISPPGPVMNASARPPDAPVVSNGFIWSNLVDRAWMFEGRPLHEKLLVKNDLWRFEMGDDGVQWTQLGAGDNVTSGRPSYGAGCNIPDLQRGYYLGGVTQMAGDGVTESPPTYLHLLTVFDM